MRDNYKLLIIGKTSPIGGVTVHVNRLIQSLNVNGYPFQFIELTLGNLPKIFWSIFRVQKFHLHSSRLSLMCLIAAFSKIIGSKSILTYHAEVGIYKGVNKCFEKYAIRWIDIPIMLNHKSLAFAKALNPSAVQISSFIPPVIEETELKNNLIEQIENLKKNTTFLFCTNAFKRFTMPDGRDVYGIGKLIDSFHRLPHLGLIISDPSGENKTYHLKKLKSLPQNIMFIDYPHSFIEVLKRSNCMIRATLTDGDSISIKEAIYLKKNVICSDVVSRPAPCIIYKNDLDGSSLFDTIKNFQPTSFPEIPNLNGFVDLLEIYN